MVSDEGTGVRHEPSDSVDAPEPGRARIDDVARIAGVTKGTVSKYLNRDQGYAVSRATRARIEDAILQLNFQPSPIARGLRTGLTKTIGLVAASIRSQFYPDLVAGAQKVFGEAGYTLMLGVSEDDPLRELEIMRSMILRQTDGLLLASVSTETSEIQRIIADGMQVVLAGRDLPNLIADTVVTDNYGGAITAVNYLRGLGHRRIAHAAGDPHIKSFYDRKRGYVAAMSDIATERELAIATASSSIEGGTAAARALLSVAEPPSAILFGSDTMALGGLIACSELGLEIPSQLSIMGFDNVAVSALPGIALTTMDSEAVAMGERAASLLIQRIEAYSPNYEPALVVRTPPLVERGSTGPWPQGT